MAVALMPELSLNHTEAKKKKKRRKTLMLLCSVCEPTEAVGQWRKEVRKEEEDRLRIRKRAE